MWKRFSLRTRLFLILGALVLITLAGGSVMVWYTYQIGSLFKEVVFMDLKAFETADALQHALVNQKGFVSYYFQDGDPVWLDKLGEHRRAFEIELISARRFGTATTNTETVDEIGSEYAKYIKNKDQVIALYKAGERKAGSNLHRKVRDHFFKVLKLCKNYKELHLIKIEDARAKTEAQSKRLRIIAGTAISTVILLGGLLAFVLVSQILNPLRRMAIGENGARSNENAGNEVKAVSHRVHSLKEDIGATRNQLAQSQEHLLHSEKLAMVGKLAAGMAHSIRNPLTSVKMRLFSLERDLDMSDTQREDFDVISEEIRHLDNIVGNFLEFSRPPKLRKQSVSPSDVVDMALDLLHYRLEYYGTKIELKRAERLPLVSIDPEQLKEVLVNLIINACEATGQKVKVVISEEQKFVEPWGDSVTISIKDDGPGIPHEIVNRVLEPFFTTKEEGTGLGLSIANRILKEHGGHLTVNSEEGAGSIFAITIPTKEV